MKVALLALFLLPVAAARAAEACSADDVCDPADDPCRIDASYDASGGCSFDFGAREVVITEAGALDAAGGDLSITAGALTIEAGGGLLSEGGTDGAGGRLSVAVRGDFSSEGLLSVSGGRDGGNIDIDAGGTLTVDGACLDAHGTSRDAAGGFIALSAGVDLVTACAIDGTGGETVYGATVALSAVGDITVDGDVDLDGGAYFGGWLDVVAGGDILLGEVAIRLNGGGGAGEGGELSADAGGDLTSDATVEATGDGDGKGGDATLYASGAVTSRGAMRMEGGGAGGTVWLYALRDVVSEGALTAVAGSADANGGAIHVYAEANATVSGDLDVSGPSRDGGEIEVEAFGDLHVSSGLHAAGAGSGPGGTIQLTSHAGAILIRGSLDVGAEPDSEGGEILVEGCDVAVDVDGSLSADASTGYNQITAHETLDVQGALLADDQNLLVYRLSTPTFGATASVSPAATLRADPTLHRCCEDEDADGVCDDAIDGDDDGHYSLADGGDDCDDADGGAHPGAPEVYYDGVDNDCDPESVDDDQDGDGWPVATDCDDTDPGRPDEGGDCGEGAGETGETGETGEAAETGGDGAGAEAQEPGAAKAARCGCAGGGPGGGAWGAALVALGVGLRRRGGRM